MYSIAISSKAARDNFKFLNSELAKGWVTKGKFWIIHDRSEGTLRRLSSVLFRHFGLESRVYEI